MHFKPLQFNNVESITHTLFNHYQHLLSKNSLYAEAVDRQTIEQLVPDLVSQFDSIGCTWDIARIFITPPNDVLDVHIDGDNNYPKHTAINWPLANCEQSTMTWYNILDLNNFFYPDRSQFYGSSRIKFYNADNCQALESVTIDQPYLVRIDVPHGITNHSDKPRMMLSFRFKPEPLHLWSD